MPNPPLNFASGLCNLMNSRQCISAWRRVGQKLLKDWTQNDDVDKRTIAYVKHDSMRRLRREFLDSKRHECQNHDPAEDGQRSIRPDAFFSDVELHFHINLFAPLSRLVTAPAEGRRR